MSFHKGSLFNQEYRVRSTRDHHLEHLHVFTMMRSQLEEVSLAASKMRQERLLLAISES